MAKTRKKNNITYIFGNTVRRIEPVRRENKRGISEQTRRNQEKALRLSLPFVLFVSAAALAVVGICVQYLGLQTSITRRIDKIQELQGNIADLRRENRALETDIETYYNLDRIYAIATQELGMVYADPAQVIVYDKTESEYVRQYDDIPE
ncbi:MAG: cell division protein FtsL [Lachnospiraceae bacterium]|nr:cell division protein FtsL [Lachnospiraceae bacterium]MBR4209886.1 cell division protein FtsL [Lachnospiraceae bacterium]